MADWDSRTLLTADPGPTGEQFIPAMFEKVRRASRLRADARRGMEIEVEGGIGIEQVEKLAQAGAEIPVVRSPLLNKQNPQTPVSAKIWVGLSPNPNPTV